ncbi:MAG: hypothetical protein PVI90_18025 [Desulfobacteraceae bacterium]|jgi:predicted hydrocarbon binding protein
MHEAVKLKQLQGSMMFLASVANGLEDLVGRGATGVTFRAGRKIGLSIQVTQKESEILKAFDVVRQHLHKMGIRWNFEPYRKQSQPNIFIEVENGIHLQLVFRNCMVRSCQFYYGHPQKNSLCMLQHGIFCGLFQQIHGTWADYEPIHSGENACFGMLKIKSRK